MDFNPQPQNAVKPTTPSSSPKPKKPSWLRVRLPSREGQEEFNTLKKNLSHLDLNTVCEEARCPNIFECWSAGTATIMILGETCTRGCRFCSVNTGNPSGLVDPREPENTALALSKMNLAYVVLTMVDRDDLWDGGASHVAQTVRRIKHHNPSLLIETLVGDFQGVQKDINTLILQGRPDVFAHNVEVVPSIQKKIRDAKCSWDRSIDVLKSAKAAGAAVTKSSLMVGIGEKDDEVIEALHELRQAEVDIITIGQYLQPTPKHAPVDRYVEPNVFEHFQEVGLEMGFKFIASGPLVRSSYRAAEAFLTGILKADNQEHSSDRYGRKKHLNLIP